MFVWGEEEIEALRAVVESGRLFRYQSESQTQRLESEWAAHVGSRHCLALNSGTSALICALAALGVGRGDEVIVPGYTFIATAAAVLAVGAVPVIAEVDETLTLDPSSVEANLSPFTKAILPVHMVGRPCRMDALLDLAKRKGLAVVEDACQAAGGSFHGARLGSLGDAGAYSFNFYKIIGAGEGGALVTNDERLHTRAVLKHDCGHTLLRESPLATPDAEEETEFSGLNFRISELQSAFLRVQNGRLEGILASLRAEHRLFRKRLEGALPLAPSNDPDGDCCTQFAFQFDTVPRAQAFLEQGRRRGLPGLGSPIHTGKHVYSHWTAIMERRGCHPGGVNPFESARRPIRYAPDMLPRTLDFLGRTVYFPMNPSHRPEQIDAWTEALLELAKWSRP